MRRYEVFITDENWCTRSFISTSRNAFTHLKKYGTIGTFCRVYYKGKKVSGANWDKENGMYRVMIERRNDDK